MGRAPCRTGTLARLFGEFGNLYPWPHGHRLTQTFVGRVKSARPTCHIWREQIGSASLSLAQISILG
jgi:hypothetical protein